MSKRIKKVIAKQAQRDKEISRSLLPHIKKLTGLMYLNIRRTFVTEAAARSTAAEMP